MTGLIDNFQQISSPSSAVGTVREVEANSLAARSVYRPFDASHGSFSVAGTMAPGPSSVAILNSPINLAAFQWISTANLCVMKKVIVQGWQYNATGGTGAGIFNFAMFKASSFTRQFDTYVADNTTNFWKPQDGLQATPIGQGGKFRSAVTASDASGYQPADISQVSGTSALGTTVPGPSFLFSGIVPSTNAYPLPLSGGVFTLDALPLSQIVTSTNDGTLTPVNRNTKPVILHEVGDMAPPLIFEGQTGLVFKFQATGGVTQVFNLTIILQWDEVPSYSLGQFT
jgi:hypothetical protein